MNSETFPASLFPLRGDVSAEAGSTTVEVIGMQNVPLGTLLDGGVPTYSAAENKINWEPAANSAVQLNGVNAGDYLFLINTALTINYGTDTFLGVRINGVLDGGIG